MQIDGIRLLRFTMREMGIPENKVRNAIRYLQDENARIVSKGAADAAIASERKLSEMNSTEDRPFLANYRNWNRRSTLAEKLQEIRAKWCEAQLRRLVSDRRVKGSKFFYGSEELTSEPGELLVMSCGDVSVLGTPVKIAGIWIWLDESIHVDYDWLRRWWDQQYQASGNPHVPTRPLYVKLGVLK